MKIKLSPELAYVIGLWRKRRSFEGLGVKGDESLLQTFSQEALDRQLTTSDKLLTTEDKVYFYHTAYRKFFQEVEEEQLERFKYLNEYSANYLAGMFDAAGEVTEKGVVMIHRCNQQDELLFLRLGFQTRKVSDRMILERPLVFLAFIKNYVKVTKEHKVFSYLDKKKK